MPSISLLPRVPPWYTTSSNSAYNIITLSRFAFMMVAMVVMSASFCVDSAPIDESYFPRFNPDRDNYKDDLRRIRSAPSDVPADDSNNIDVVTELPRNVDLKVRSVNPSALVQGKGVESVKPSSGRVRRGGYWYPYWIEQGYWTPSPTEGSHYVYDSYLGKVRRAAPNVPSTVTTPSPSMGVESMITKM